MFVDFKLDELGNAALFFLKSIGNKKVIAFHGDLGAGKTTFISSVCELLRIDEVVTSPTFSIINEYQYESDSKVYHIDLYRLKNEEEAIAAGVQDCLDSGHLCLVEWPGNAPAIFPPDTVHCYLVPLAAHERKLKINM